MLSGDPVMSIGDLNAKLGKDIIKGVIHDMSTNGEHLLSIIGKYNLIVVNSLDICRGLFTRVNNKNTMEISISILEYVLVSNDSVSWVVGLQIDEGKLFTPWRKLKRGKRFSDHSAMLLSITATKSSTLVIHRRKLVCNFNNKSGWDKFQKLATNDETFQTFGLQVMMLKQVTNRGLTNWNLSLTSLLKKAELGYIKSSIIKKYDL